MIEHAPPRLLQLKVQFRDVYPAVWRRFTFADSLSIADPWQSGGIDHAQGTSEAGNPRVRKTIGQSAWLWLRNQPDSALTLAQRR